VAEGLAGPKEGCEAGAYSFAPSIWSGSAWCHGRDIKSRRTNKGVVEPHENLKNLPKRLVTT